MQRRQSVTCHTCHMSHVPHVTTCHRGIKAARDCRRMSRGIECRQDCSDDDSSRESMVVESDQRKLGKRALMLHICSVGRELDVTHLQCGTGALLFGGVAPSFVRVGGSGAKCLCQVLHAG